MKHVGDNPLAGGWNPAYQEGARSPEAFEILCRRGSRTLFKNDQEIFRLRRKYTFRFGQDVKDLTGGVLDHVSIELSPCGRADEQFYGRPQYDVRFFTVSDEWRKIMTCATVDCEPDYCLASQTSAPGQAMFSVGTCDAAQPQNSSIPLGTYNKNMPYGFTTIANGGANKYAGIESVLVGNTPPNSSVWEEPLVSVTTFNDLVTSYGVRFPTEFIQGETSRQFTNSNPELRCQSLLGLPESLSFKYNHLNKYTTFRLTGRNGRCTCPTKGSTQPDCTTHSTESLRYSSTYQKFAGVEESIDIAPQQPFGSFTKEQVEAAFKLDPGSLVLPGDQDYDCLSTNNFWTKFQGEPYYMRRFITDSLEATTEGYRLNKMQRIFSSGRALIGFEKDQVVEHFGLGCYYSPKPAEVYDELAANGAIRCTKLPGGFVDNDLFQFVVAYVDENTRLMYAGNAREHSATAQFMTQFYMVKALPEYELERDGDLFAFKMFGPNGGDYSGYKNPGITKDFPDLGNVNEITITMGLLNLSKPCPDDLCSHFIRGRIPNPAAPNASFPPRIIKNQCTFFPCMEICTNSSNVDRSLCEMKDNYKPNGCSREPTSAPTGENYTKAPVVAPAPTEEAPTGTGGSDAAIVHGLLFMTVLSMMNLLLMF